MLAKINGAEIFRFAENFLVSICVEWILSPNLKKIVRTLKIWVQAIDICQVVCLVITENILRIMKL